MEGFLVFLIMVLAVLWLGALMWGTKARNQALEDARAMIAQWEEERRVYLAIRRGMGKGADGVSPNVHCTCCTCACPTHGVSPHTCPEHGIQADPDAWADRLNTRIDTAPERTHRG